MTTSSDKSLAPGLYESPLTTSLERALADLGEGRSQLADLDPSHAPVEIGRLLFERIQSALTSFRGKDHERLARQIALANQIVALLAAEAGTAGGRAGDELSETARKLLAILPAPSGKLASPQAPERPATPLSASDLVTGSHHDRAFGSEIRLELASANRVGLLCAFLRWSGLRIIREPLEAFLNRHPGGLRVITTVYAGSTERRVVDELVRLGAQVKISYDKSRTRLHAKAWLFHRETGFSTAMIGSSNLSSAALLDGLEWNVRLSQVDNGAILEKFATTFDQYWAEPEFCNYDPETDAIDLDRALKSDRPDSTTILPHLEITPRPHQQIMLDELTAERERGHNRNLVVAATGTGKTIVAALDYVRLKQAGMRSLLFVAHRREILDQSRATFRIALRDGSFGEALYQGARPIEGEHVFASVQSLNAEQLAKVAPDAYDVVIVDEFHHAAAPSYERLLGHLKPKILLGLTATPERTDGKSILDWFDGRIASELRLWRALEQQLLSPFHYFGLRGPDLNHVRWVRGRYNIDELRSVYTGHDFVAKRVLQEVHDKVTDVQTMRALGFCVDIVHAEFMAERFREAGIAAAAVLGTTDDEERKARLAELRSGKLRVLFCVDLFNEGVDLPEVDTILFLRPTESATLFLQQLGRGLRRQADKDCCLVLDFIGHAHRKFRFDTRFRALIGGTRRSIERQVKEGFPSLPSGCNIILEREAQEAVLRNLREQVGRGRQNLVDDLRQLGDVNLQRYLAETGLELEDVYGRSGQSFTDLRRQAGFAGPVVGDHAPVIERALARLLHIDDATRLSRLRELVRGQQPPEPDDTDPYQRMLFVLLGFMRQPLNQMSDAWQALWNNKPIMEELRSLLEILDDQSRRLAAPLDGKLASLPLRVHATYTLDEIMAASDERDKKGAVKRIREGVLRIEKFSTDAAFVTLEKSAKDYSPTTLYRDYPITRQRFHWETQPSCHPETTTGRRYMEARPNAENTVLLFVRERRTDARGETLPYLLLGPAYYEKHTDERPMKIIWHLRTPIPAQDFQTMKIAAG